MKLLFAYFDFENKYISSKSFRGLGEIGLNFSTTHFFSVKKDKKIEQQSVYKLSCQEKEQQDQIPQGFWGDRIYNITALVGKNGIGKSSIIYSLINSVVKGLNPGVPFILVLQATASTSKSESGDIVVTNPGKIIVYYGGNIYLNNTLFNSLLSGVCPTNEYPNELTKAKIMLLDNTLSVSSIDLDVLYSNHFPIAKMEPSNEKLGSRPIPEWVKQFYNKSLVASIRYSNEMSNVDQPLYLFAIEEELSSHFRFESYQELRFLFNPSQQALLEQLSMEFSLIPRPKHVYVNIADLERTHRNTLNRFSALKINPFEIPIACRCLSEQYFWTKIVSASLYLLYSKAYEILSNSAFSHVLTEITPLFNVECEKNDWFVFAENIISNVVAQMDSLLQNPSASGLKKNEDLEEELVTEYDVDALKSVSSIAAQIQEFVNYIGQNKEILDTVFHWVTNQFREDITPSANGFDFRIDIEATNEDFQKLQCVIGFLEHYREASRSGYFMLFSTGLSSGEKNLLRMMTQFHYLLTNPLGNHVIADSGEAIHNGMVNWFAFGNKGEENKDNNEEHSGDHAENTIEEYGLESRSSNAVIVCDTLFLFLDEADLTYHPEWQRLFVAMLTAILPKVFQKNYGGSQVHGCKDIQVFLATHSPLMLGDFPKSSVIYLNRNGKKAFVDDAMKQSSFGQNLYIMLKDDFFMEDAIGEFARRKINEVAKWCGDIRPKLQEIREKEKSSESALSEDEQKTIDEFIAGLPKHRHIVDLLPPGIIRNKLHAELDGCARLLNDDASKKVLLTAEKARLEEQLARVNQELASM